MDDRQCGRLQPNHQNAARPLHGELVAVAICARVQVQHHRARQRLFRRSHPAAKFLPPLPLPTRFEYPKLLLHTTAFATSTADGAVPSERWRWHMRMGQQGLGEGEGGATTLAACAATPPASCVTRQPRRH